MILEMIFKTQRITGDTTLFTEARNQGKAKRNGRRCLKRKKQTKHQVAPNHFKKTHIEIAKKMKVITENGQMFLICRDKKIQAPRINFKK